MFETGQILRPEGHRSPPHHAQRCPGVRYGWVQFSIPFSYSIFAPGLLASNLSYRIGIGTLPPQHPTFQPEHPFTITTVFPNRTNNPTSCLRPSPPPPPLLPSLEASEDYTAEASISRVSTAKGPRSLRVAVITLCSNGGMHISHILLEDR